MVTSNIILIILFIIIIIAAIYNAIKPNLSASTNYSDVQEGELSELECVRCFNTKMIYNGSERFHVGSNSAPVVFGNLGELFVKKQTFDMYYCPNCGKVEFYFRKKK